MAGSSSSVNLDALRAEIGVLVKDRDRCREEMLAKKGQLRAQLTTLKEDYGVESLDAAREKLRGMEAEIAATGKQLEEQLAAVRARLGEQGA